MRWCPAPTGRSTWESSPSPNQAATWNVPNLPANPQAQAVRVLFNFFHYDPPAVLNVTVNGHAHPTAWPYPDSQGFTWRTLGVTIPITDLVAGTNVVTIGADQAHRHQQRQHRPGRCGHWSVAVEFRPPAPYGLSLRARPAVKPAVRRGRAPAANGTSFEDIDALGVVEGFAGTEKRAAGKDESTRAPGGDSKA